MTEAELLATVGTYADVVALFYRVVGLGWFCGLIGLALAATRWPRF